MFLILVLFSTFTLVYSHVALTFPPARNYDWDFLDNVRTKPPCGVPKGTISTSLPAGLKFNVTWHLAYPHRGGFKIELLDPSEQTILNLTPTSPQNNFIGNNHPTLQSYPITLPKDLVCRGCTLRLIRQAKEWGHRYIFWSCADVDIVKITNVLNDRKSACSGHGQLNFKDGKCDCDHLFSGAVCQYKDECWDDIDCGQNGKCINIDSSYPKKQCFCKIGWFGVRCSKESPIKNKDINLSTYSHKVLTNGFDLYWKIINSSKEIEIVLKLKGKGYAAIGWKPRTIDARCKSFPDVSATTSGRGFTIDPRNGGEIYGSTNVPLQSNATNEKTSLPKSSINLNESKSNKNSKIYREPKSNSKVSLEVKIAINPALELENKTKVENEPIAESEPKAENEPAAESQPKAENEPIAESEPKAENEPIAESEPKAENEPAAESQPKTENEPIAESEPKAENEPAAESQPKAENEPIAESEPKAENEPAAESQPKTENEPIAESEPKGENEPAAESQPKDESKIGITERSESEPENNKFIENLPKAELRSKTKIQESEAIRIKSEVPETELYNEKESFSKNVDPVYEIGSLSSEVNKGTLVSSLSSEISPEFDEESRFNISSEDTESEIMSALSKNEFFTATEPGSEIITESSTQSFRIRRDISNSYNYEKYPPISPYTPKGDFNAMDCSDIVIGVARGNYGRVFDYYTRDRSTPRVDSFYGGQDDLSGAFAFESNGITTVAFRRPLNGNGLSDHSILREPMDIIWAKGQERDAYIHNPPSGLETVENEMNNFYKEDEIKYHGHDYQRGKLTLNWFEDEITNKTKIRINSEKLNKNINTTPCFGDFRYPAKCVNEKCEYISTWSYTPGSSDVSFVVTTRRVDKWTGIGFSYDTKMPSSDVILAWVEPGGRYVMMDAWMRGYSVPTPDSRQSIYNISAVANNGLINFKFSRPLKSFDERDVSLDKCAYFIFPVGGGPVDSGKRNIWKHIRVPIVSDEKICLSQCSGDLISKSPESPESSLHSRKIPKVEPSSKSPKNNSQPLNSETESESISTKYGTSCLGAWSHPANCEGYACDYKAIWEYLDDEDEIMFTISTKNRNKWTGIGFSHDGSMSSTDAILGLVEESGRFFLMDTWLQDYSAPPLDSIQNIHNMSAWRENGITNLRFHRNRKTSDLTKDFQFTESSCPFFVFPVQGGVFNAVNKRIRKHEAIPIISDERICIGPCIRKVVSIPVLETSSPKTEVESVNKSLKIESEPEPIPETESTPKKKNENSEKISTTSTRYIDDESINEEKEVAHSNQPSTELSSTRKVSTIPTSPSDVIIIEIKPLSSPTTSNLTYLLEKSLSSTLASQGLPSAVRVVPKSNDKNISGDEKDDGTTRLEVIYTGDESKGARSIALIRVKRLIKGMVEKGTVGDVNVEKGFLVFKEDDDNIVNTGDEFKQARLTDEELKWCIIAIGVSCLVVLFIIQAACMLWREKQSNRNVKKDKQMVASHYKDYSATTASSAYSYENFAVVDDPDGLTYKSSSKTNSSNGKEGKKKSKTNNSQFGDEYPTGFVGHSGPGYNIHPAGHLGPGYHGGSTLPRDDKGSWNYPSIFGTSERGTKSGIGGLGPDYYFMPHQRRYSGEVVRVFVDYNSGMK